jgi:hypothetical protein
MSRYIHLFVVIALFAACDRRGLNPAETRARAAQALRGALGYPGSNIVSVSAGSDAAELVLTSPASVDTVASWYRRALPLNKWTIKSDTRDPAGAVTIYAQQETRPLWITLQPGAGGAGTTYQLIGVFADSAKRDSGR